ncbi:MAG: hypothetical protein ACRD0G_16650 [Acidimicrobiales bacterium]
MGRFGDMRGTAEAAPGRVEPSLPAPTDPNDPALQPIGGVDLARYAQLSKAIGVHGLRSQDQIDQYLVSAGLTPEVWQAAYDGWNERFEANMSLSMLYAQYYQAAQV